MLKTKGYKTKQVLKKAKQTQCFQRLNENMQI